MVLLVSQSRSSNASQSVTLEVINVQFEINNHFKFQFLSYWFFSNTSVSDQLVTFLQLGWNLMLAWLHKVQHWCLNVSGMCLRNSHGDYFFRLKHISWRSMDPHQHLKQKVQLFWMLLFWIRHMNLLQPHCWLLSQWQYKFHWTWIHFALSISKRCGLFHQLLHILQKSVI